MQGATRNCPGGRGDETDQALKSCAGARVKFNVMTKSWNKYWEKQGGRTKLQLQLAQRASPKRAVAPTKNRATFDVIGMTMPQTT